MKEVVSLCSVLLILCLRFGADFFAKRPTVKTILIWNTPKRLESGYFFGEGSRVFVQNGCAETRCYITSNRSSLPFEKFDAIVMNMYGIPWSVLPEDLGYRRRCHQRFVSLSQESPSTLSLDATIFNGYFNWTMTYKRNADVSILYGRVRSKPPVDESQNEGLTHRVSQNFMAGKNKSVVWMASHCETDGLRETYVRELSKYIDVDVYGACGNFTCPRDQDHWVSDPQCYELLAKRYKFYLSFENSVCSDYVSEKFFEALAHDLIPVVYGGADYTKLAPPHSFIDARRYTPRQLARQLHRLATNATLYNEFFRWKEHYEVEVGAEQMARHGYCDLCQKLHQDSSPKIYEDAKALYDWNLECVTMTAWTVDEPHTSVET